MDRFRLIQFSRGGRPVQIRDLNDGTLVALVRDTLAFTPPAPQTLTSKAGNRYGGQQVVAQTHDNAGATFELYVNGGSTGDSSLALADTITAELEDSPENRYIEWRPEGSTVSEYFELRGPGEYEMQYRWIEYQGTKTLHTKHTLSVAPLAEGDRMTIIDDLSRPEIILPNGGFEAGIQGWVDNSTGGSPGAMTQVSTWANTGVFSGRVNGTTASGTTFPGWQTDAFPVVAGWQYRAGAQLNVTTFPTRAGGPMAQMLVRFFRGDQVNSNTVGDGENYSVTSSTGETAMTAGGRAPAGATHGRILVYAISTSASAYDMRLDSARVVEGVVLPAYSDGMGDYTKSGLGQFSVYDSELRPSNTSEAIFTHVSRGYDYEDGGGFLEYVTGASVTGGTAFSSVLLKRDDARDNHIEVRHYIDANALQIIKRVAGVETTLQNVAATAAVVNTNYTVQGRIDGNLIHAEVSAVLQPNFASVETNNVTHQLSASDAAVFGIGTRGKFGIRIQARGTDYRYRMPRFYPHFYKNRSTPETFTLRDIPGTAPAKVDVTVTDSTTTHFALLAWAKRVGLENLIWASAMDTLGTGLSGWKQTGLQVNNQPTSISSVFTFKKYRNFSMEVVTPATSLSGPEFKIWRRFKRGVPYTFSFWARSTSQTTGLRAILWGSAGDLATSLTTNLSPQWQKYTVTWTPNANFESAVVAIQTQSATATTFQVDSAVCYEGNPSPLATKLEQENNGGNAPFGVISARGAVPISDSASGWGWTTLAGSLAGEALFENGASQAHGVGVVVDPTILSPDEFARGEIQLEVWARMYIGATTVSPKITLSARSIADVNFGSDRYTAEYGTLGKTLVKPTVDGFRFVRLGTVTLYCDPQKPTKWLIVLKGSKSGVTGAFGVDYLILNPIRTSAKSPTGKPVGSTYPSFLPGGGTKRIASDLRGFLAPNANYGDFQYPDHGLSGAQIVVPPGTVDVLTKLCNMVPDDPTASSTLETLSLTGSVYFDIIPRYHLTRGA